MRRALGLGSGSASHTPQQRPEQARQRHRFVQDGGVPVVMLSHKPEPETAALRERIVSIEAALETERVAHNATRRALHEQQVQAQALQTRLAHAELAHTEALETERKLRIAAQEALAQETRVYETPAKPDHVPMSRRGRAAESVARATPAVDSVVAFPPVADQSEAVAPPAKKTAPTVEAAPKAKRGRPRINPIPEPKPVRWWTPSFKAKSKA